MPDPNSHAGLTPLVKYDSMPPLWWLTPWTFAVQQWNARAKLYAQCQDLQDDLATARQDTANFSDHAVYHQQRHADQSYELNALRESLNDGCKTYIYERPVNKAKRKPAPKAKAKTAKKAKR